MSCNRTNRTTVSAEIAADNRPAQKATAFRKWRKTQAVIEPDNVSAFSGQLSDSHRPDKNPPPFRGGLSGCPAEGFINQREFQQLRCERDDHPLDQSQCEVVWHGARPDEFGTKGGLLPGRERKQRQWRIVGMPRADQWGRG
jgi:hypothetical protein